MTIIHFFKLKDIKIIFKNKNLTIIKRSVFVKVVKEIYKVSGLMDMTTPLKDFLNSSNMTYEAQAYRRAIAHNYFFFNYMLLKTPIRNISDFYDRIRLVFGSRPFEDVSNFSYPKNHPHGLKSHMPAFQNHLACMFASYGFDYNDLPHNKFKFDTQSYNTKNKKPIPLTYMAESNLMESAIGHLLNKDIKGIYINPDNVLHPEYQTLFYKMNKQPNPDAYILLSNENNIPVIKGLDVKFVQEPEKTLSLTKGRVSCSPYLDMKYLMQRSIGDIGGGLTQAFKSGMLVKGSLEIKEINKLLTSLQKNCSFQKNKKYDSVVIQGMYNDFCAIMDNALINPLITLIIPSVILDAKPNQEFIDFLVKNFDSYNKGINNVLMRLEGNILFPGNNNGVHVKEYEKFFLMFFNSFDKALVEEILENYNSSKKLLILE